MPNSHYNKIVKRKQWVDKDYTTEIHIVMGNDTIGLTRHYVYMYILTLRVQKIGREGRATCSILELLKFY